MNERVKHAWSAALSTVVALAAAAPVFALTPSLEQVKAESGMRFNENAGLGHLRQEYAVDARGERGTKPNLAVQTPVLHKKTDVPPPAGSPSGGSGGGDSLGRNILTGAGIAIGALATAGLAVCTGGLSLAGFAIAGAVAAGYNASLEGARGWSLAKKAALGAAAGVASLALIGGAIGSGAGALMERLFKRK